MMDPGMSYFRTLPLTATFKPFRMLLALRHRKSPTLVAFNGKQKMP